MIKLVSVNVKWDHFTQNILDLIAKEQPDILCLQEVLETDVPAIEAAMGASLHTATMGMVPGYVTLGGVDARMMIGIVSRLPIREIQAKHYAYHHDDETICDNEQITPYNRILLSGVVADGQNEYRISTTHFTWTPNGFPDDNQTRDLHALIPLLEDLCDFVLCGDLNAPRGMATFDTLASRYQDHIPKHYTNSLDPELHRLKGSKELMIDGLFSTPAYECHDVELRFGVSDHAAIIAKISRASEERLS